MLKTADGWRSLALNGCSGIEHKYWNKMENTYLRKNTIFNYATETSVDGRMLNQSCVCNVTNVKLPDFVLSTLSLGDKFNFSLNNNKDIPAFEGIRN